MENSFIALKTERLDKFLVAKFPSLSRAYLKGQIKLGNILVYPVKEKIGKKVEPRRRKSVAPHISAAGRNPAPKASAPNILPSAEAGGLLVRRVKPAYVLREGDQVAFAPEFTLPDTTKLIPNPAIKLNIIYEDNDVLVIDKPAGLTIHPRQTKGGTPLAKETNNTLVSGLISHYPPLANIGDNPPIRPGIVHRLDKDTSGVLIVAKNQKSFDWLKSQFKERRVQKKYLALVQGLPKNMENEIAQNLARSKKNPTKQKISGAGKIAITRYKVLKQFKKLRLMKSKIAKRREQIKIRINYKDLEKIMNK